VLVFRALRVILLDNKCFGFTVYLKGIVTDWCAVLKSPELM